MEGLNVKKKRSTISKQLELELKDIFTNAIRVAIHGAVDKALGKRKEKITIPEAGTEKYYVISTRYGVFTTIGADNRHHAANKATKLFGPEWDFLRDSSKSMQVNSTYAFMGVKDFKQILNSN